MVVRTHTGKETVREREGENKTPSGFLLLIIFLARKMHPKLKKPLQSMKMYRINDD